MSTTPSNPVQSSQPKGETLRHTPTPWRAAPCGYLMGSDGVGRFGPREVQVGKIGDFFDKELLPFNRDRWQGDLELIVTAVNSHATLTARVVDLEKALRFYADGRRYRGANQQPIPNDPYAKPEAVYILDVTRDGGAIANAVLQPKGAAV